MRILLLVLLVATSAFTMTPAFQSLVNPNFASPYTSYNFNVIYPSPYENSYSPLQFDRQIYDRIVYLSPISINTPDSAIQQIFGGLPGFGGTPSIVQLKSVARSMDGSSNNLYNVEYNSAGTPLSRRCPPLYRDGSSQPINTNYSPREASNSLGRITTDSITLNEDNVTMAFTIWGQFMDHDFGLTEVNEDEQMPIHIPNCDPFMDVECSGSKTIPFRRSQFLHSDGPRNQMNSITGWIDASSVYGSTEEVGRRLRSFKVGQLKYGRNKMLPLKEGDKHGQNDAGDVRVNENILLTSYHTIFVREHNRLCKVISTKDPRMSDDQIYHAARNYVTALIQKITFDDFLPILLGPKAYAEEIGPFKGYDENINPTLDIQFTTAAYRFGHSLLVPKIPLIDRYGQVLEEFRLNDMFFSPEKLDSKTMDNLLRGLCKTITKKRDGLLVDQVRNLLITDPQTRHINMDLYALNIQRARDHGIEKFNFLRVEYGLPPLKSFEQLTGNPQSAARLQNFYSDVNQIDAFVGFLYEKPVEGGIVGEAGARVIGENFNRLRVGDRFWYEKDFPTSVVAEIKTTKFSEVIIRNTGILQLEEDIFHNHD